MIATMSESVPLWLTYLTAFGTAASALVVASQAWYTRKSVAISRDSTLVAQQALRESRISRIESGAPRLSITRQSLTEEPTSLIERLAGRSRVAPLEPDRRFVLPRDAELVLSAKLTFSIRNDGPVPAAVKFSAPVRSTDKRSGSIEVGTVRAFTSTIRGSVADWIRQAEAIQEVVDGEEIPEVSRITATYVGPRDSDLDEEMTLVVFGSLLREVPEARGTWELRSDGFLPNELEVRVLPTVRTYWSSRSAGTQV